MILPKDALLTAAEAATAPAETRSFFGTGERVTQRATVRHRLVLASASPRRLALLEQVGIEPTALRPATIDETPKRGERPRSLAQRLAREKAITARERITSEPELHHSFVLAADTVVAIGRLVLGKPEYLDEAAQALATLSGPHA